MDLLSSILVAEAKELYGDQLRVMTDQGDYSHILALILNENVRVNFRIPKDSTESDCLAEDHCIEMVARCPSLWLEYNDDFIAPIPSSCKLADLLTAMDTVQQWWNGDDVQRFIARTSATCQKKVKEKKKGRAKQGTATGSSNDEEEIGGCKMKTAADVINRIQWDPDYCPEHFVVGYMDRFVGIMERPFDQFDWSNFSEVDPQTAAVPHHRIQYFKYKSAIVWDRKDKIDYIFGSTGVQARFQDIKKEEDKKFAAVVDQEEPFEDSAEDSVDLCNFSDVPNTIPQNVFPKNIRPNFYLSIPITDPATVSRFSDIQQSFASQFPDSIHKMPDPGSLHVTLMLFCQDIDSAGVGPVIHALKTNQGKLKTAIELSKLNLSGLTLLKDRVLCSTVSNENLTPIMKVLATIFTEARLQFYANDLFHATICYMKKAKDASLLSAVQQVMNTSRFRANIDVQSIYLHAIGANYNNDSALFTIQ